MMTVTIYSCFVLLSTPGGDDQWEYIEVPDDRTMRAFAVHLEQSEQVLAWHCRGYRFKKEAEA